VTVSDKGSDKGTELLTRVLLFFVSFTVKMSLVFEVPCIRLTF